MLFELEGKVAPSSDAKEPVQRDVQAKAQLIYNERVLQGGTQECPWARQTVRQYETARANIKFSQGGVSPQLREERRLIGVSAQAADDVALFSPLGPLTRNELDLVDVPANSAVIDGLLPGRSVAVGESWQLETPLLPALLRIDAVAKAAITCKLDRIEKNQAIVHATGTVSGASGGVATEIALAAKYSFDMTRQRVSWFAMSVKEKRSVGHAQPGLEATARIQMAIAPRTTAPGLDPSILQDLDLAADAPSRLLEFSSQAGGFSLLLTRNWHEMVDRPDVAVLRLVDRGDLIAQCNLSALPPMEDGVPFTLADFQQDVKNVLGDDLAEFVAATESVNDNGLHVMRVVANGTISDLDIQWIYYHITNRQGHRVSCVFTMEAELADRFGAADQETISSFLFVDNQDGDQPAADRESEGSARLAANRFGTRTPRPTPKTNLPSGVY